MTKELTDDDLKWRLVSPSGEELRLSDVSVTRGLAEVPEWNGSAFTRREYSQTGTLTAVVHWPDP